MVATMHDRERERDRERAPDRENSAMPRPAYRGEVLAHSPCDWDPTGGTYENEAIGTADKAWDAL